jgi:hypothetical protein
MKMTTLAAAVAVMFTVAACNSPADTQAEATADALEAQAAATPNEAQEEALNAKADQIEQQAGNVDGGATTNNTPDTSPSQ